MKPFFTVRRIVIAGILGAIALFLGFTRLGYVPVPTPAGNATIMHLPIIIGAILEGWGVGVVIGAIFGISSFLNATLPLFKDPLVSILPRLFIGVVAWLVYAGLKRFNLPFAVGASAFLGSLSNTVFVLGMATLRGYMAPGVALTVALTNGIPEAIVAVIITMAVVLVWMRFDRGRKRSRI